MNQLEETGYIKGRVKIKMDPITVTVTEGDPDAQKDSMQQKMDEPRSMKDAVKKVMLGNRLSVAVSVQRLRLCVCSSGSFQQVLTPLISSLGGGSRWCSLTHYVPRLATLSCTWTSKTT